MRCEKISLYDACHKICNDLNLEYDLFVSCINEDKIGGYPDEWPGGSVFGVEGQILYALTRIIKPETIIEFGTCFGCSTEHFIKALDVNSKGKIYTVDIVGLGVFKIEDEEKIPDKESIEKLVGPLNKVTEGIYNLISHVNDPNMSNSEIIQRLLEYKSTITGSLKMQTDKICKIELNKINDKLSSILKEISNGSLKKATIILRMHNFLGYVNERISKFFRRRKSHPRVIPIQSDGVEFSKKIDFKMDFIFEDGPHTYEFTKGIIKNCLPYLNNEGLVLIHDVCAQRVGDLVSKGIQDAVGDFETIFIDPSNCGLGYWKKKM